MMVLTRPYQDADLDKRAAYPFHKIRLRRNTGKCREFVLGAAHARYE
jgi:hypothetical protein